MNVFEDLVVELKEENLLESTFIERASADDEPTNAFDDTYVPDPDDDLSSFSAEIVDGPSRLKMHEPTKLVDPIHETDEPVTKHEPAPAPAPAPKAAKPAGKEFFKKKAMGEVSSLQMVEHVITGVEREYLKVMPKPFDDFEAKKVLNAFLNSETDVNSEEHKTAEFQLMHETESWCTALSMRDSEVPVYSLREYCERSRPALSSQALLALGRFYRNLPYTEPVRAKFDFVLTRLFSRPTEQERRVGLFTRDEMLTHINTLYSDWSSIPLYDVDEDDSKVMLTALSFEDLAIEAENASTFDQLIESDFFGRLRMFKESISELFYAPQVTAAAIDCNIRIGNAYVALIERERHKLDAESVMVKYGDHDSAVSEVTGKTLQLAELLKELKRRPEETPVEEASPKPAAEEKAVRRERPVKLDKKAVSTETVYYDDLTFMQKVRRNTFGVSPRVIIFAIVMVLIAAVIFVWSSNTSDESASTAGVKQVSLDNSPLKDFVQVAKISPPTLYAQMKPSWDNMNKDKKQEIAQKLLQLAQEQGCTQVSMLATKGPAGYISATRLDIPR